MNKLGLLLILIVGSFILLASTCVKHTPYPYRGPVPPKKGVLSVKVKIDSSGKSASKSLTSVFWSLDSSVKKQVVPGTKSYYMCDTSGTVVFDSLAPRSYIVLAGYYNGKDTLRGVGYNLSVISNTKQSYTIKVKK